MYHVMISGGISGALTKKYDTFSCIIAAFRTINFNSYEERWPLFAKLPVQALGTGTELSGYYSLYYIELVLFHSFM